MPKKKPRDPEYIEKFWSDLIRRVRKYFQNTDKLAYPPAPAILPADPVPYPVKKPRKPKKKAPKRNGR